MKNLSNEFLTGMMQAYGEKHSEILGLLEHLTAKNTIEQFSSMLYQCGFNKDNTNGLFDFIKVRNYFHVVNSHDFCDFSNVPTMEEITSFDDKKQFNPYVLQRAVIAASQEYEKVHGRDDWGSCGFANTQISCGRSRKIINELSKLFEINKYERFGRIVYDVNLNSVMKGFPFLAYMLPVQTIDFYEAIHKGLKNGLISEAKRLGYDLDKIDIYSTSYID